MDKQWIETTPLNRQPYQLHIHSRVNGRGGGVALITKSYFDVKQIQCGSYPSFEYATWEVTVRSKKVHFTTIYHPPHLLRNKSTNRAFLDDFTNFMMDLLPEYPNNVLLGDFNLHISNEDDIDSAIFLDTLEAMGLYQHVSFPTHKSGNTLDLVISEIQSRVTIMTTALDPYITDHRAIILTLNIKKVQPRRQIKNIRKLHTVTVDQWKEEFKPDNVLLSTNLEDRVMSLSTEFR